MDIPVLFRRLSGRNAAQAFGASQRTDPGSGGGAARPPAQPRSLLGAWRRCRSDAAGSAALEFAAAAPLLILIFGGVTDLSVAIWDHITTAAAVQAGADYALWDIANHGNVQSGTVGTFLSTVSSVVTAASRTGSTLSVSSVTVTFNNATDGSNFGNCYCVPASGVFPGSMSTCSSPCTDGSTAGKYVQITAVYNYTPLSPADTAFLSGNYTETAMVRVQ
jgi:Flp pilus assembly protein TadG